MLKRLLKEPLLHFLLIGAGLFGLFYQVADPNADRTDRIVVTQTDVQRLASQWQRQWKRQPIAKELDGLIESHVRETVLYREALALGLDQDDVIIRRRLGQKLEFLFKDLADRVELSAEELSRFLAENPDRYTEPGRLSFKHIYLSRDKRGAAADSDARELLQHLRGSAEGVDPAEFGDRFLYPYQFENQSPGQIGRVFGAKFAESISALETGKWRGPVESGYGLHLVHIDNRTEPRLPALEEIADKVRLDVQAERRKQADAAFYRELRQKYDVKLEKPDGRLEDIQPQTSS